MAIDINPMTIESTILDTPQIEKADGTTELCE
jgi:hypothetical protein